jgi:alcohol dehydrogenase class IV
LKQQEYIGFGSVKQLGPILNKLNAKRIFLVTGKNSYHLSGAQKYLKRMLVDHRIERFYDFSNNPKSEDITRGIEKFKKNQHDIVIAVGGGSIIDMAKLINYFACNNMEPTKYLKSNMCNSQKVKPLIAIPTTSGTGSEATQFAVFYIDKKKYSLDNENVLPNVAIVDPTFTISLPKYITATSGMDALAQAIESYWNINSTNTSKALAKEAIELILSNLLNAVNNPTEPARLAMAKASNLAGKAINITRTTAVHSISYPFTSYFGIPHGHSVALTLSSMLEYNASVVKQDLQDSRGCEYVRKTINEIVNILGQNNIANARKTINSLISQIGIESKLSKLGISTAEDIELITSEGFTPSRMNNNPRKLTSDALRKILYEIN